MKKTFALLFLITLVPTSLFSINDAKIMHKFFSKNDLKKIEILISEFDNHILNFYAGSSINFAYNNFFVAISESKSFPELREKLNFPQNKQADILNKVGKRTIKKIWNINLNSRLEKNIQIKGISLKGNYMSLLEEVGRNNAIIHEYFTSIQNMGDISPFSVALFKKRENELQIKDKTIRFIIAVHYFSINKELLLKHN